MCWIRSATSLSPEKIKTTGSSVAVHQWKPSSSLSCCCFNTPIASQEVVFVHAYTTARCPRTFRESIRPLMWRLPHIMAGILSGVSMKSLFLLRLSSLHVALWAQKPRCDPALIDLFACTSIPPPDQPEGHFALLCSTSWCKLHWAIWTISFKWDTAN